MFVQPRVQENEDFHHRPESALDVVGTTHTPRTLNGGLDLTGLEQRFRGRPNHKRSSTGAPCARAVGTSHPWRAQRSLSVTKLEQPLVRENAGIDNRPKSALNAVGTTHTLRALNGRLNLAVLEQRFRGRQSKGDKISTHLSLCAPSTSFPPNQSEHPSVEIAVVEGGTNTEAGRRR